MSSFRLAHLRSTTRRQICALAAIALWLTSAWAGAACCCDALPAGSGGAQSANAHTDRHAEGAAHAHAHQHGSDAQADRHSHNDAPAGECESLKSLHPPLVYKASAPPVRANSGFVAIAPVIATLVWRVQIDEARVRWSLPPPLLIQGNPFLSTIRLLL